MIKAYEPLHHKYRPTSFDELIGQNPITATLKQALISNPAGNANQQTPLVVIRSDKLSYNSHEI